MKKMFFMCYCLWAMGMLVLISGCQKQSDPGNEANSLPNRTANGKAPALNIADAAAAEHANAGWLKMLHAATARYHSTTQAINAGYVPDDHCVAVPGVGGMGYHWANPGLVDPVFELLKPEVVLYEKAADGSLKLVAVEYIVINVGQPRPMFGDHPFDIGGTPVPVAHWSLHVWVHKTNPSGVFVNFNPNVSCH
ncbi:MAG: hypothetical protein KGZ74_09580 [Chitinophagaceae bacterium]|nr:hypothetical protein [Chitinophagaceae bacterium]